MTYVIGNSLYWECTVTGLSRPELVGLGLEIFLMDVTNFSSIHVKLQLKCAVKKIKKINFLVLTFYCNLYRFINISLQKVNYAHIAINFIY